MASESGRGASGGEASGSFGVSGWRFCTDAVEERFDVTVGTNTGTDVALYKPDCLEDRSVRRSVFSRKIKVKAVN